MRKAGIGRLKRRATRLIVPQLSCLRHQSSNIVQERHVLRDVISFMRGCRFLLVDIWDLKRIGPMLSQVDLLFTRCRSILEDEAAESNEVMGSRFQWRGLTFKSNDSREGLSGPDASGSEATSALILADFRIHLCCRLA